jgi:hypothetical protein
MHAVRQLGWSSWRGVPLCSPSNELSQANNRIYSRHLCPPSPLLVSRQVIDHLLVPCQGGLLHPLDLLQLLHEAQGGSSTPRDEGPAGLCSAKVWPGEESISRAMYAMWIGWVSLLMGWWSGVQSRYSLRRWGPRWRGGSGASDEVTLCFDSDFKQHDMILFHLLYILFCFNVTLDTYTALIHGFNLIICNV